MSLPLIAVPCLAVFGLPSIGPATAEAEADESVTLDVTEDLGTAAASAAPPAFPPIVDAGQTKPAEEPSPFDAGPADRSHIDPTSDRRGAAANRAVGLEEVTPRPAASTPPPAAAPGVSGAFAIAESPAEPASVPSSPPANSCEAVFAKLDT
ncbi:MAG TPA: hypothetical protein VF170_03680, partial [Planctomycetaceae bacterium]